MIAPAANGTGSQLLGAVVVPFRRDITLGRGGEPDRHAASRLARAPELRRGCGHGWRAGDDLGRAPHRLRDEPVLGHRLQSAELEPHQLDAARAAQRRGSRSRPGSRAGRPCGGAGSARRTRPPRRARTRTPRSPGRWRSWQAPMQARNRLCSDHGLDGSERYAQVTSTASSEAGPAGQRARARERRRGPVLQRGHVPVAVEVDLAPGAELVLDVLDPAPLVDRRARRGSATRRSCGRPPACAAPWLP